MQAFTIDEIMVIFKAGQDYGFEDGAGYRQPRNAKEQAFFEAIREIIEMRKGGNIWIEDSEVQAFINAL